jgi:soluble lytic murein transglycosylase
LSSANVYSRGVKRYCWRIVIVLLLAAIVAFAATLLRSPDAAYRFQELVALGRYHEHDTLIEDAGKKYGVDPKLVKAVVWRESRFHPDKIGAAGERGLMQLGEAAARDWATARKVEVFVFADLFDAKTNIEAGTWYLGQAIERWKDRDDPVRFALAEYNAGRSRVEKWAAKSGTAAEMLRDSAAGSTRRYVEEIMRRFRIYREHGW